MCPTLFGYTRDHTRSPETYEKNECRKCQQNMDLQPRPSGGIGRRTGLENGIGERDRTAKNTCFP